jgi:ribosomal protein S27E
MSILDNCKHNWHLEKIFADYSSLWICRVCGVTILTWKGGDRISEVTLLTRVGDRFVK